MVECLMTQDEIREKAKALRERRAQANRELEVIKAEFNLLKVYCSHPDAYGYTAMGEPGWKCPDCGTAT